MTPATNGQTVKLTIDRDLQYAAQAAIEAQVDRLTADWANIVVIEAKTGKVRAITETRRQRDDPGEAVLPEGGHYPPGP